MAVSAGNRAFKGVTWIHKDEVLCVENADDVLWILLIDWDARVTCA